MFEPDTVEGIYTRIRDAIINASNITNWSSNSPERAITREGFAQEFRERQHEALAVQLSSYIDYAGRGTDGSENRLSESDLEHLGIDDPSVVDIDLLYEFMEVSDLDELAKRNSVQRDPGSFAKGTVVFQTNTSEVIIPSGSTVGTQPDENGEFIAFETTQEVVSADGSSSVEAPVEAAKRGSKGNVGSGQITYLPESISGVNGEPPVNNSESTSGGEDEETNAELRERAKSALVSQAIGGTREGVANGLVAEYDGLDSQNVDVIEYDSADPQYFEAIVDGGPSDSELEDTINRLEPVGVNGVLVRPTQIIIDVTATVTGTDVDTTAVEDDVREYVENLGVGDPYIIDAVIATIMNADDGIQGIDSLSHTVVDETHTYQSGTSIYSLDHAPIVADNVKNVVDASGDTYTNGTDYDETDNSGDGEQDAIEWSIGGSVPDDNEDFDVDYEVDHDISVGSKEKAIAGSVSISVV